MFSITFENVLLNCLQEGEKTLSTARYDCCEFMEINTTPSHSMITYSQLMCLPAAVVQQHNSRHATCFLTIAFHPGGFFGGGLFSCLVLNDDLQSKKLRQ